MNTPKGRATTPEQKKAVINQLLAAWMSEPQLRLGQLIVNAVTAPTGLGAAADLFYIEDEELVPIIRAYYVRADQ